MLDSCFSQVISKSPTRPPVTLYVGWKFHKKQSIYKDLLLNVYLATVDGIIAEILVDLNTNVYTDDANSAPVVIYGIIYRQYSYNYPLPNTMQSGFYDVNFRATQTNTNISVPITINSHVETLSPAMTTSVVLKLLYYQKMPLLCLHPLLLIR